MFVTIKYYLGYIVYLWVKQRQKIIYQRAKKIKWHERIHEIACSFPTIKSRCDILLKRYVQHSYNNTRTLTSDIEWFTEQLVNPNTHVLLAYRRQDANKKTYRQTKTLIYEHLVYIQEIIYKLRYQQYQLNEAICSVEPDNIVDTFNKVFFDLKLDLLDSGNTKMLDKYKSVIGTPPELINNNNIEDWRTLIVQLRDSYTSIIDALRLHHDVLYKYIQYTDDKKDNATILNAHMRIMDKQINDSQPLGINQMSITPIGPNFHALFHETPTYTSSCGTNQIFINPDLFDTCTSIIVRYDTIRRYNLPIHASMGHVLAVLLFREACIIRAARMPDSNKENYLPKHLRLSELEADRLTTNYIVTKDIAQRMQWIYNLHDYPNPLYINVDSI